jgi:hypothetical protein
MFRLLAIGLLTAAATVIAAELPGPDALFDYLRHVRPSIQWLPTSGVEGDFDGDGRSDLAALGIDGKVVLVAIGTRPVGSNMHVQFLPFRVDSAAQAAICALPARLEIHPLECSEDGQALPGCRDSPKASALSLVDDECDSIHMYWDHQTSQITWWRR